MVLFYYRKFGYKKAQALLKGPGTDMDYKGMTGITINL
jgi:hypothetical protein